MIDDGGATCFMCGKYTSNRDGTPDGGCLRCRHEAPKLDDGTWHCMTDAPKDGTEVELLLRHPNYRYCKTDEERAQWEQVVRGKWIDFNGGGWTWHGMYGSAWGWRPLPSNVEVQRDSGGIIAGGSAGTTGSTARGTED